ncbi:hypothetical protein GCM10009613_07980 [Pseudonocardia kongjuensis]|uniref:Uncharacterized protein n=1 Tax=Pseudonocardia kongjuensis TaxID=102227 RepID=A0ABN1XH61_9PSEU
MSGAGTSGTGCALGRIFGLPDEVPGWQRVLVGIGSAVLVLVAVVALAPAGTPAWAYALVGWLGVLGLGAAASALLRRFHPAVRRADDDRTG